ncbi:hypothetical protein EGW08_006056 [Elysia chlorotica]|uniref:Uncharacterized protein n=1 Tax=Elysia chlorotica TaxID=188477 RepID=A0A433TXC2_ELYCH|nr:hypothetical protein EGW08_006056 [Elysia chlorotica]
MNAFSEDLHYLTPFEWVITGVSSTFDSRLEDRRFKFRVCQLQFGYMFGRSETTAYLNDYDARLDYTVPEGKVLTGWKSVHDNYREDRRHKMVVSDLIQFI